MSNTAIVRFLLTPTGLAAILLMAMSYLLGQLLLIAGLMAIAAMALRGRPMKIDRAMGVALRSSLRLLRVGVMQLVGIACVFAPFLGLAGLTYGVLLTGHDINYYLTEKPPAFLAAAAIGIVLGVVLLVSVAAAYVRCLFVVPTLLFEGSPIRGGVPVKPRANHGGTVADRRLRAGLARRRGTFGPDPGPGLCHDRYSPSRHGRYTGAGAGGFGGRDLALARMAAGCAGVSSSGRGEPVDRAALQRAKRRARGSLGRRTRGRSGESARVPRRAWALGLIALGLALVSTMAHVLDGAHTIRPVSITAHRGASRKGAENTLAALRKAIDRGVDYAEIDVHLTADGVPVLVHDEDFQRLAGDPRRPGELTLDQIRRLDVGSRFDRAFAGERVATLAEAIDAVRGRIKLNIELKPTKSDREGLARSCRRPDPHP